MLTASFLVWLMTTGQPCGNDCAVWAAPTVIVRADEPLDVPAVEEVQDYDTGEFTKCDPVPSDCKPGSTEVRCNLVACEPDIRKMKMTVTTCQDKHRVLEHDEQQPPTYWCRKVVSQ